MIRNPKLPGQLTNRQIKTLRENSRKLREVDGDATPGIDYHNTWSDVHDLVGINASGCQRTQPRIDEEWVL